MGVCFETIWGST